MTRSSALAGPDARLIMARDDRFFTFVGPACGAPAERQILII